MTEDELKKQEDEEYERWKKEHGWGCECHICEKRVPNARPYDPREIPDVPRDADIG